MTKRYFGCTVPWLVCYRDNHAGCHRRVTEAIAELRRQWKREAA